ncbi:MAG: hypothetical protein LBC76_07135 [Treponema sp.]|jgi:hypothetical protein|nr:hypothetical protein [Treponema sp.]
MKIKIISLLLLVFALFGCNSFKKQIDIAKQREPKFKVELKSPKLSVGSVEAQLEKMFFGLKKVKVDVTYSPIEDALCLEFKRNTVTNYQFYNRSNRAAFLKALEKYLEDYDNRNLVNNKTTKKIYGSDEGYLIWKITRVSSQYHDNVDFSFGYLFKEKSPFFTITQGEAEFDDIFASTEAEKFKTNGEFQLFFTRAQAMDLAAYFDPEFLQKMTTTFSSGEIDSKINYEEY